MQKTTAGLTAFQAIAKHMDKQLDDTRHLATINTTIARIKDPVFKLNKDEDQALCAKRVTTIQAKPEWTYTDVARLAFYKIESAKDANEAKSAAGEALSALTAVMAKLHSLQNDQLFMLFGIRPGTSESELIQAKAFAENLLKDARDREAQLELDIEQLQLTIAAQKEQIEQLRGGMQDLTEQRDEALKRIETLSADLQTALKNQTTEDVTAKAELDVVKQQLADAMKVIESQNTRLVKYALEPKFDNEIIQALEDLTLLLPQDHQPVTPQDLRRMKYLIHFINVSILGAFNNKNL